jgi:hypothetical protein
MEVHHRVWAAKPDRTSTLNLPGRSVLVGAGMQAAMCLQHWRKCLPYLRATSTEPICKWSRVTFWEAGKEDVETPALTLWFTMKLIGTIRTQPTEDNGWWLDLKVLMPCSLVLKVPCSGMLRSVVRARSDVTEKPSTSIIRVTKIRYVSRNWQSTHSIIFRRVRRLLVTANVPSSQILVTLMMEALVFSETSALTRATQRNYAVDCKTSNLT